MLPMKTSYLTFVIFFACSAYGCHVRTTEYDHHIEEIEILKTIVIDAYSHDVEKNERQVVFVTRYIDKKETDIDPNALEFMKHHFAGTSVTIYGRDRLKYRLSYPDLAISKCAYDSITGSEGEILTICEITWLSSKKVRVSYGQWSGLLSSVGYTCIYEKKNGKWVETDFEMDGES
jgi:hypothetical protein